MQVVRFLIKPAVFTACLAPALRLTAGAFGIAGVSLGADPVAALLHGCGHWALNFLMITLCMTPLRDLSGSTLPLRLRRMFGLFVLFYAVLHLFVYLVLDQDGKLSVLWQDILKRPYITIGMLALLLLIPLGATSTQWAQRRLGRRWLQLHRLVYVIAILGVWHYWWQVKKDVTEPRQYAIGLALLLGYRVWKQRRSLIRFGAAPFARIRAASSAGFRLSPSQCKDR
jgi:methionine sulfoxide reductase heme-binding subunit